MIPGLTLLHLVSTRCQVVEEIPSSNPARPDNDTQIRGVGGFDHHEQAEQARARTRRRHMLVSFLASGSAPPPPSARCPRPGRTHSPAAGSAAAAFRPVSLSAPVPGRLIMPRLWLANQALVAVFYGTKPHC